MVVDSRETKLSTPDDTRLLDVGALIAVVEPRAAQGLN